MKMPWSLFKRRPAADTAAVEIDVANEVPEADDGSSELVILESSGPLTPPVDDSLSTNEAALEPSGSVADVISDASVPSESQSSRSPLVSGPTRSAATRREQRKKTSAPLTKARTKPPITDRQSASPTGPETAGPSHSGIFALDDEIKELRRQLVERLRLQNAQLEEMLKRFGNQ